MELSPRAQKERGTSDRTIGKKYPLLEEEAGEPQECKPRIRRGLYNQSIHQGNVIDLVVCATGWPTPTVKWYKNDEELRSEGPDGRQVIWTDERGLHHLVILNCKPEDEGDYSLIATNKLGTAKTEGTISVIKPREVKMYDEAVERGGMPFPPGFIRQIKNKHVFSHMPTIFDCLVVGHPAPEVDWYHNGQKIVPGGRIKIQASGGGSHAIIILDTQPEDAGEYLAVARNSHGTAQSSAILEVTVPHLDKIKFDGSFDVTPYLTEEYGFRKINYASFPTPPDRGPFIKEVTGHYLTLSWIPTKRSPPRYPQVTYVIEIRELPEKEWTLLDFNIPEPVCKVRGLELGKSYQFRVRAENIYGISDPSPASPPSKLMAPPQPVLDKYKRPIPLLDPYAERALDQAYGEQYACAPWFAPGVVDKRYCAENDTLTITLNVQGFPDPHIQWKFRGWDVDTSSPTSNLRVATYGGSETVLTVHGFSIENVGQYQCIAKNQYGEAQQNVFVELANRPNFMQPLQNKVASSGKPLRLDVRVEGNPFPEIKWLKEWHPLVESSRIKFVQDGPYLCSLIINDPMWRDSGIYSCVAVNDAGKATTSCSVTVEAEGDYNDVQLPTKRKVVLEARKVREIYEIDEADEKTAASGAPFHVTERATGRHFLAQLKPLDATLERSINVHNAMLENPGTVQMHQVLADHGLAVIVYEGVGGTLLDSLIAPIRTSDDQDGVYREEQVQIFMRQLLAALQYMHNKKIAHLDLRPEAVLLQDDHIRLADFGQSRRLMAGKIKGDIQGSPEFVSPEIASCKDNVTLATDMWSAGVLTYVLLSGISPFLGDSDQETLGNVQKTQYSLDVAEFDDISDNAKDFIKRLLQKAPQNRMSVAEALEHPWMREPLLKDAKLASDCLREFKYRHKWLERRVFVQQTPSEQLTQLLEAPLTSVASSVPSSVPQPQAVYDYLRIKDVPINPSANTPEDYGRRPDDFTNRATSPMRMGGERRRQLIPQDKGEAPSSQQNGLLKEKPREQEEEEREPQPHVPLRLVRGEHRDIEEEIANRILSDISEENSIAGSLASLEEVEPVYSKSLKDYRRLRQRKSRSRSSTPQNDASETSTTPLASPALTIESADPVQAFFGDLEIPNVPGQFDPRVPIGAPLFLEGLGKHHTVSESPTFDRSSLSPRSLPGTKSPILLSPGREHSMEVVIATKRGVPGQTEPHREEARPIHKKRGDGGDDEEAKPKATTHDDDFENLMDEVEKVKQKYRQHKSDKDFPKVEMDDLEKYRPKNIYKEPEIEFTRPEIDVDDYPWESNYQIGPDTFLLATRGAAFNARVRDYRRCLWGDGAPLVEQGYLGFRNSDITVRERRRYTDLIREDQNIAKSVDKVEKNFDHTQSGAIRRIRQDISKIAPSVSKKNSDGTFAPIFRQRLRDVCYIDDAAELVLECQVLGNPVPQVTWFQHDSAITEDGRHQFSHDGRCCHLVIKKPQFFDCGEYSCVATNELGTDKCSARLYNGELPPRPGRPEIEMASDSELFLTWEAPDMPTSLDGIIYKLEIRPAGENDHFSQWTVISDSVDDEAALVKHLEPRGVYQFRVTAKNGFGWGAVSVTSRAVQTRHRGAPKISPEHLKGLHFNILTMPQRDWKGKALTEISEEDEEDTVAQGKDDSVFLNTADDFEKRFKLESELFRGRFSVLRNATDSKCEVNARCVAKIRQATPEASTEFEALKTSQHENVARMIAAYEKDGFQFVFTEKLYEDVFQRFSFNDSYSEEQIAISMRQLAAALQWIHFRGVVHLDVQPSNVMYISKRSWVLKLIDFENAQMLDEQVQKPAHPNIQWAAPEVHQPDGVISAQTDMWGLGVICFTVLSGFHPFSNDDDTEKETIEAVKNQKCDPNLIPVQASQEALSFATWALKKNPSRRMRTDEALSHRWLSSDPHMARRREGIKYPSSRLRKTAPRTTARKPLIRYDEKLHDAYGEKKTKKIEAK
ncbi:hypothetical protein QR680_008047 [Steinernema hermaphroditum]|uniref:Uncharacterized protein n=1 Tax=Steinernema hermaphroditum TaxID=289476 RepID=A0AA39IGR1_9BILA|nr:hypothetical protein QR680_008047 [Steinernema hermaphroditum]